MNKENSADDCLPKFFKVYIPDESGDDLELPISFNSCLPESLPKTVTVRSIYGNIWTMVFRRCCGDIEKFVLVEGWKRIVKDEDLKGGEFLAFEFDGSRLFNFCIYSHETCKKLRGSVQTKEIKDQTDGDNDKSSDDIIVIDDDDGEVNDDQDYGDEDKSSDNIIVIDDDDDYDINDVQDYNEEGTSSEDIKVLDDDDDDAEADNDVQNYVEEDSSSEDIIVIDDDQHYGDDDYDDDQHYGDDDYDDDENKRKREKRKVK